MKKIRIKTLISKNNITPFFLSMKASIRIDLLPENLINLVLKCKENIILNLNKQSCLPAQLSDSLTVNLPQNILFVSILKLFRHLA